MTSNSPQTSRHSIRLQGPWEVIPPGEQTRQPIRIPASWRSLFGDNAGTATFFRKFNSPSNLASTDQVLITLPDQCGSIRSVRMNGIAVSPLPDRPLEFDVTQQLQLNNELEVCIDCTPEDEQTGGLWTAVLLEIQSLR